MISEARRVASRVAVIAIVVAPFLGSHFASGADVVYLDGHTEAVRDVGLSPDGKWLVSGGDDGRIVVRPADNLQQSTFARPREGGLMCLTFSKSGEHVYAAGNLADFSRTTEVDGAIKVELKSGQADEFVEFPVQGTIKRMALIDDDAQFVYVCASNELLAVRVGSNEFLRRTRIFGGFTEATAISPDSRQFAVMSQNERNDRQAEPCRLSAYTQAGRQTLSYTFPSQREYRGAQVCFTAADRLVLCQSHGKIIQWSWDATSQKWTSEGNEIATESGPFSAIATESERGVIHVARDQSVLTLDMSSGAVRQKSDLMVGENPGGILADPIECLEAVAAARVVIAGLRDGRLAVVPVAE